MHLHIVNTSFGVWHTGGEKLERIMGCQAISMTFDYPESNTFCTSSGSAINQLDWLNRYFEAESDNSFSANFADFLGGHLPEGKDLNDVKGILASAEMLRQKCKEAVQHQEGSLDFE